MMEHYSAIKNSEFWSSCNRGTLENTVQRERKQDFLWHDFIYIKFHKANQEEISGCLGLGSGSEKSEETTEETMITNGYPVLREGDETRVKLMTAQLNCLTKKNHSEYLMSSVFVP